jgi:hypothetical protein
MTSLKQFEANRRNAMKSTGPTTAEGKERSRCNAVRHGLTAETVIGALEDADEYSAFEAAIIADYDAQSAAERDFVLRLASLLWRLRRATTMETGLFEMQAGHSQNFRNGPEVQSMRNQWHVQHSRSHTVSADSSSRSHANSTVEFARCFLRLADLPDMALDRLSRYEARLWRQARQVVLMLEVLDRRKPQERRKFQRSNSFRWPGSVPFGEEIS